MATVSFEEVVQQVEQLSSDQQKELVRRILMHQAQKRPLTPEEKILLLRSAQIAAEVNEEPSVRREDWYGDDGR